MSDQDNAIEEYKINIDMWKHYDNLRQEKNKTFLTANTILVATLGFLLKDGISTTSDMLIPSAVSFLGATVCILWFFLQSRNAKYIRYHIFQTQELEKAKLPEYSTFRLQQKTIIDGHEFEQLQKTIGPVFVPISTNWIDRILSGVMLIGWLGFSVFLLFNQNC